MIIMEEATRRFSPTVLITARQQSHCIPVPERMRAVPGFPSSPIHSSPSQSVSHPSHTPSRAGTPPPPQTFQNICHHSSIESTPSTLPPRPLTQKYPFSLSLLSPPLSAPSCPQMTLLSWPAAEVASSFSSLYLNLPV